MKKGTSIYDNKIKMFGFYYYISYTYKAKVKEFYIKFLTFY